MHIKKNSWIWCTEVCFRYNMIYFFLSFRNNTLPLAWTNITTGTTDNGLWQFEFKNAKEDKQISTGSHYSRSQTQVALLLCSKSGMYKLEKGNIYVLVILKYFLWMFNHYTNNVTFCNIRRENWLQHNTVAALNSVWLLGDNGINGRVKCFKCRGYPVVSGAFWECHNETFANSC